MSLVHLLVGHRARRRRNTGETGETGSISVELAILVPALMLIFGLIFVYGRVGQVNGSLQSGTRDAARSATKARSYDEAVLAARKAVELGIEKTPQDCKDDLTVTVGAYVPGDSSAPAGTFEPGKPLRVTSTCTYDISDAGIPGAPGTITSSSTFISVVDDFRSVDE